MSLSEKIRKYLQRSIPSFRSVSPYKRALTEEIKVKEEETFGVVTIEKMLLDPQVRLAIGARNGMLMQASVNVACEDSKISQFIKDQYDQIWTYYAPLLLQAKIYGYFPFEVIYKGTNQGTIEVDYLLDLPVKNTRLVYDKSGNRGLTLKSDNQSFTLSSPKYLLATFSSKHGAPYGQSILERAYSAWHEKWMKNGVKNTLKTRMIKDAYIGDIFWYPMDRKLQLPDGRQLGWMDIAYEVLESRSSGRAMALPTLFDDNGNKIVDYTPPQEIKGNDLLFRWKKDVDYEILKALEIPPEIIEATNSGSYGGRSVPLSIAQSAVMAEFTEILSCLDRDIFRPLIKINFGENINYKIQPLLDKSTSTEQSL
ncbi:MAG: hypothetical protein MPJ24_08980 [Pirellulaceae bacterium]|nr:hypothetical protein [Pirellulaceae bacterium]